MADNLAEQASLAAMRAYGLGENEIGNTLAACREALLGAEAEKQLAVAAALREAAKVFVATVLDNCRISHGSKAYLALQKAQMKASALPPDAGAALDRYVKERSDEALAAERERCAKVAERPMLPCDLGGDLILDPYTAETIAAAIRAQGDKT